MTRDNRSIAGRVVQQAARPYCFSERLAILEWCIWRFPINSRDISIRLVTQESHTTVQRG